MKKVCLYIATHNKTGLKYFGKTTRHLLKEDLQKQYHGSGTFWRNHLKKYGDEVTMEVYGVYNEDEVKEIALKFSKENNIVESKEWANLVNEDGLYGGSVKGAKRKKKECPYCDTLIYPSEYMYHFEYCSNNENRIIRRCFCEFCNKEFNDYTGKGNHELICSSNPNRKTYECQYCFKQYKDFRNKKQHEDTCDINPCKKKFECKFCNKKIKTNSAKTKHEKICSENPNKIIRIYICSFCDKKFKNVASNKDRHEKYHCNMNPNKEQLKFECICGKTYSDKGNFVKHTNKCLTFNKKKK